MIKVLMIDDHRSILDAFSNVINAQEDMQLVGCLTTTIDALASCKNLSPDVVLTDICVDSHNSGIELTKSIKEYCPDVRVVVMSGFDEISYIPGAKQVGADAFLSKSRPIPEFIEMIRAVMKGEGSFPEPITIPTARGQSPFSEREIEVLRLLCQSYSRDEIAAELNIASGTVKRHLENMLIKSGCKKTMELVVLVVSKGWIVAD